MNEYHLPEHLNPEEIFLLKTNRLKEMTSKMGFYTFVSTNSAVWISEEGSATHKDLVDFASSTENKPVVDAGFITTSAGRVLVHGTSSSLTADRTLPLRVIIENRPTTLA